MGNCCTDNAEGLALIRAGVRSARAAAGSDDLHLWGLDLFGGGWCHCPGCRTLTPSDQALRLANAVADDLSHGERVFHLAYHDTFSPPRSVLPHPRVWAEFAPRERCYAHAIDDPTCHANPRYRAALEAHLAWFDGRVEVFEYYADTILFGGCAVPLIEVIARDLAYYQRVGVGGVSCLTFGRFSHLAHGANLTAFAAGTHDPRTTRAGAHDHCRDAFGPAAALAAQYLRSLERAIAPVLTWGDVKVPPRTADAANALAQAVATRTLLEEGLRKLPASPRADAERRLFHYTLNTLDGLRRLCPPGHDADAVLATLHDLAASFHDVDLDHAGTWGTVDLPITHSFYDARLRQT